MVLQPVSSRLHQFLSVLLLHHTHLSRSTHTFTLKGRGGAAHFLLSSPPLLSLQNLYQNRLLGLAAMASPARGGPRPRCKDASRHSCGPDAFAVDGLGRNAFALGLSRSTSDTDLLSPDARSTLTISSSHYAIGQTEDLVVTWDIKEEVDAGDWIGMYLLGEAPSRRYHGNAALV